MPFVTFAIWSNVASVASPPLQVYAPAGLTLVGYTPGPPAVPPVPPPNPPSANQPAATPAPAAPQPPSQWYYNLGNIPGIGLLQAPQTHWSRVWTTLPAAGATRNIGFVYTANFLSQATAHAFPPIQLTLSASLNHLNQLNPITCTVAPAGGAANRVAMTTQHQYLGGSDEHILTISIRTR